MLYHGAYLFLLADDDADDKELFCSVVQEIDPQITITTVKSGKELLEKLANCTPDLIFLDINMFPVSGLEALKAIKEEQRFEDLPVVMFSCSGRPLDMHQSYQLGAALFIRKSDTYATLKALLKTTLEMDWTKPEKIRTQYSGTFLMAGQNQLP